MSDSPDPLMSRPPEPAAAAASVGRLSDERLEFRAVLLLAFMLALIVGSALYVMYARGVFESTQKLVLVAEDSEGVVVGMNLTFSGFPIGRVRHIELAEDGKARIVVDVSSKDAHWLRTSSVFTLVRGLVGSTNIRAYTGLLTDPLLPDGAVRSVLQGDAAGEVPKLIASAKDLIENLSNLTGSSGALGASLGNLQVLTTRLNGTGGALRVLLGGEAEAKKLLLTMDRTNALLARLDGLVAKADTQVFGEEGVMLETRATVAQLNALLARLDGLVAKADTQVFGEEGVMLETRAAVAQLNALLGDARSSLKKVDAVLVEAQAVGANAREASNDLGSLRGEVEASLRKVEGLINEINRKWPFKHDAEVKLP